MGASAIFNDETNSNTHSNARSNTNFKKWKMHFKTLIPVILFQRNFLEKIWYRIALSYVDYVLFFQKWFSSRLMKQH